MSLQLESARLLTWRAAVLQDEKKPFTKVGIYISILEQELDENLYSLSKSCYEASKNLK